MKPLIPRLAAITIFALSCTTSVHLDPANATYFIDNQRMRLENGNFEQEAAPGSASGIQLRLTDKQVTGDLDGDGQADGAVVLTYSGGGSGTFYYVATLLTSLRGEASNAILVGDRISVEQMTIINREIHMNYLTREPNQAMASAPTVKTSKNLSVKDGRLQEVRP